jgi:hypothetical protein
MSTGISYTIVDVFATGPFTGNPAGVIVTREPLAKETMQRIAAYVHLMSQCLDELISNFSEFNLPTFVFLYPNSVSDPSSHALT